MRMSKLFAFVLLLCLPFSNMAQSAWTRVSPLPQENTINDITKIPGTNRLMAVGEGSTIMTSDDAGETWDIKLHPARMNNDYMCKGIHFINETTGFISGSTETILKTTDAGLTWKLKYKGNPSFEWACLNDVCFSDQTTGFTVGDDGLLLGTTNAGNTWKPIPSGVTVDLNKIVFADSLIGFIFSSGINCLKTTDGGLSWNWEPLMPDVTHVRFYDCYFVNETTGFVYLNKYEIAQGGIIFKTEDSGITWNPVFENGKASDCKFAFYDEQIGMASCAISQYHHVILRTEDGGNAWTEVVYTSFPGNSNNALLYADQSTVLTLGGNGVINKSTDDGLNWLPKKNAIFSNDIYKAQFVDTQNGYVLTKQEDGHSGVSLKKTTDGGETWTLVYDNYEMHRIGFCFLTAETGFLHIGNADSLRLRKTENGGETWSDINTGFNFDARDIHFIDENNGIIIGKTVVIRTNDGGLTWENITPQTGYSEFAKVKYRNADEVYMGGIGGGFDTKIFKSVNGGSTWEVISINYVSTAEAIDFPDDNTIVIGAGVGIFMSTDNGITWTKSQTPPMDYLAIRSLEFPSSKVGYAIGHGELSNIKKTTDGGRTWISIATNVSSGFFAACFFDENHGMAFGSRGVVVKTTTGGVLGIEKPIHHLAAQLFTAAPNPFVEEINIMVNDPNISFPLNITLTDIAGWALLNQQINGAINQFSLSANNLKPGIYICQISSRDGRKETIKLIKR